LYCYSQSVAVTLTRSSVTAEKTRDAPRVLCSHPQRNTKNRVRMTLQMPVDGVYIENFTTKNRKKDTRNEKKHRNRSNITNIYHIT